MPNLFEYTDYRTYLADVYAEKKAANSGYSYKVFAEKVGLKDKSCIYSIIKGTRNLSDGGILKISRALKFRNREREYFEILVSFNQARTLEEQNHHFARLSRAGGSAESCAPIRLRNDQYELCSKWYHVVIRSLLDTCRFKDDYAWLGSRLEPAITANEARQSVALLEKLGLIVKGKDGVYRVTGKSVTTGDDIVDLAIRSFHAQSADLAKRSLDQISSEHRNISGLTLGISLDSYKRICEEIRAFQLRIMELANTDENADRVYQLNFHLFPTTKVTQERKADL